MDCAGATASTMDGLRGGPLVPAGEAYVTPVGDDLVGVAVLSRSRRGLRRAPGRLPGSRPRRSAARPRRRYAGAGPLRQRVRRRTAGRVLLVGDAAGCLDALTGEGIALALATAGAAVRCLAAGRPDAYERAWVHLTRRHRLLTGALLAASRRPAPPASWSGSVPDAPDVLSRGPRTAVAAWLYSPQA